MTNKNSKSFELAELDEPFAGVQSVIIGRVVENEGGSPCMCLLVELPPGVMYLVFLEIVEDIVQLNLGAPVIGHDHEPGVMSWALTHGYKTRIYYLRKQLKNNYKYGFRSRRWSNMAIPLGNSLES